MKRSKFLNSVFLFGVIFVGLNAGESRTVFYEEFDRYGDFLTLFEEGASVSESPGSFKHLSFNPKKRSNVRKKMFEIPKGVRTENFDITFKVNFPRDSKRQIDVSLFFREDSADGKLKSVGVGINENGSSFKNSAPSPLPPVRLTKNDADLSPFPDWRWHNIRIEVRANSMVLYVERDGVMIREASAIGWQLPLAGFNFNSDTSFNIDSIKVTDFGLISDVTKTLFHELAVSPTEQNISFTIMAGSYPSQMNLDFISDDGKKESFKFTSFASRYGKTVRRAVPELKDGKIVTAQKFVSENIILPNAGFRVTGPDKLNFMFYTRPCLSYRYENDAAMRIVSDWEKYPAASETLIEINVFKVSETSYQLWFEGKYVTSITMEKPLSKIVAVLPPGASFEAVKTDSPIKFKVSGKQVARDERLLLPLDVAKLNRPGKILPSLGAKNSKITGYSKIDGIPFIVSTPEHALDLGVTRENLGSFALECDGYLQRSAFDAMPESLHFRVPTAQYLKAYAVCTVADTFDKIPEITARLTKFRPGDGRAQGICDSTVILPRNVSETLPANVKKIGELPLENGKTLPLYLVGFSFDAGSIQDVLVDENNPFLDFEFVGKLYEKDNYYLRREGKPSGELFSSVQVLAATLEKSPVEFSIKPGQLTNSYYPDEKASMSAKLKAIIPGKNVLEWSVRDIDGKVLDSGSENFIFAKVGDEKDFVLNFKQKEFGWYDVEFTLKDTKNETLMSQKAAFSLLPANTRKAGYESPYFVWNFGGAHGTPRELENIGEILKRMGVRRTLLGKHTEKDAEKWGLTLGQFGYMRSNADTPEKREEEITKRIKELLEKYPHCKEANIFHESGGGATPLELIGGKTELTEKDVANDKKRFDDALFLAKIWRKVAPDVRLVIGNSGDTISLVAQLFRQKFPREYIDAMGEESVGMTMPPERSVAYPNWQLRELARIYGYDELAVDACFEWKSRVVRHFTPRKHAAYRTRDALIALAWKQNLVPVVGISEMANSYYNTIWGDGAFSRWPLLYPFPVFNATSTLTQILDSAIFIRMVPTGSKTVYVLEFKSGDNFIYAFWTARGEIETKIALSGSAPVKKVDTYGKETSATEFAKNISEEGGFAFVITEEPVYLITPAEIKSVSGADATRSYPWEKYSGSENAKISVAMDNVDEWQLVMKQDKRIEAPLNPLYLSAKRPGKFVMRNADDNEKGAVIELELQREGECAPLMQEYTFISLKNPVTLPGEPSTLGIWVKGDSSWGKIYWEIEDADGEIWLSAGTGGYGCQTYDWPELAGINFDGWHFVQFPLNSKSPVKVHSPGENEWQWQHDGSGDRKITYPVKIRALGISLSRKTLNLLNMEDASGIIRLKDLSTY